MHTLQKKKVSVAFVWGERKTYNLAKQTNTHSHRNDPTFWVWNHKWAQVWKSQHSPRRAGTAFSPNKAKITRLLQMTSGYGFLQSVQKIVLLRERRQWKPGWDKRREKEKERKTTHPTKKKAVRIHPWQDARNLPNNWGWLVGAISKTLMEETKQLFPIWPNELLPVFLMFNLPDSAEGVVRLSVSQELSFMDFPSSKCFCSVAGQIRPQHAWLESAAHPGQLQPGGQRPEAIIRTHIHKLFLSLKGT